MSLPRAPSRRPCCKQRPRHRLLRAETREVEFLLERWLEAVVWRQWRPKKVNWDLKRDIQGKLDRLERRTQRSLVELLRERLEKEAEDVGDGYAALD